MPALPETARAHLDALEAERQAALTLSEQKAEEAKLIKARQEGFQAAIKILGSKIAAGSAQTDPRGRLPMSRRGRRPIRDMILRELLFSGHPMTTAQIAKAIHYNSERTEKTLERLEEKGEVLRNEDLWTIGNTSLSFIDRHVVRASHDKSREPPHP